MHDIRIPRNSCSKPSKHEKNNYFSVIQRLNLAWWRLSSSEVNGKCLLWQPFQSGKEHEPSLTNTEGILRRQTESRVANRLFPQVLPPSQARLESEHASMLWRKANASCSILARSGQHLGQFHLIACKASYLSPDPNGTFSHGIEIQILGFPLDPAISSPSS